MSIDYVDCRIVSAIDSILRLFLGQIGLWSTFVLISLALRSPRLGAVAMVPNLIPVLLFFGALGSGMAPLSLPVSLIGSMALGIAIDDTVH